MQKGFKRFLKGKAQRGQAMAEFAIVAPIITALLVGVFFAFVYLWRTANVDWALFASGAATGSYGGSRAQVPLQGVVFNSLQGSFRTGANPNRGTVSAQVGFSRRVAGPMGFALMEVQRGQVVFRLWRFYPGPDAP